MKPFSKLFFIAALAVSLVTLAGCKKDDNGSSTPAGDTVAKASLTFCNDTTSADVNMNGVFDFPNIMVWNCDQFSPELEIRVDSAVVKTDAITYPMNKTYEFDCSEGGHVEVYCRLHPDATFDTASGLKYDVPCFVKIKASGRSTSSTTTATGIKAANLLKHFDRSVASL